MQKVVILEDKCKGCSLCVVTCPKKILVLSKTRLNIKGYSPVECTDQETCISCKMCTEICPDVVIELYK
ncbi:4Fe-4S binding protein [Candidatus Riflebacteria bacterium]